MLFKVTYYLTVVHHQRSICNNLLFEAGNNLIVETETPIKTEDLNPGSNGGGQQLANNDQLSILPHGQEEIHSPSSSASSSNALVGFDPSKRSFTEDELRPSPIRSKECYHKYQLDLVCQTLNDSKSTQNDATEPELGISLRAQKD